MSTVQNPPAVTATAYIFLSETSTDYPGQFGTETRCAKCAGPKAEERCDDKMTCHPTPDACLEAHEAFIKEKGLSEQEVYEVRMVGPQPVHCEECEQLIGFN